VLGEVAAQIRAAAGLPLELLAGVHAALEQVADELTALTYGSDDYDAQGLPAQVRATAEWVAEAYQLCRQAQQLVEQMAARLVGDGTGTATVHHQVAEAVARTGPTAPHPSTGTRALDGTWNPRWAAQVARELPERPGGQGPTTGLVYGPDGSCIRVVSGQDTESARALLALRNAPGWRQDRDGYTDVAGHVETKTAVRMREQGITHAVVVINNRMCDGPLDCYTAVGAILPIGYVLDVWDPGASGGRRDHDDSDAPGGVCPGGQRYALCPHRGGDHRTGAPGTRPATPRVAQFPLHLGPSLPVLA